MWQSRSYRSWRRRAMALGAVLLLGWAVLPHAPSSTRHLQYFPTIKPDVLAQYLADFSNHALLYPQLETWVIKSEWSNFTSWQYDVSYSCGPLCSGRADVIALAVHEAGTPQHAAAQRHRVLSLDAHCTRLLPLLPWPALCEEIETETLIVGEREGSQLTESVLARCSPLAVLLSHCPGAAELVGRRQLRLRALSAALAPRE